MSYLIKDCDGRGMDDARNDSMCGINLECQVEV